MDELQPAKKKSKRSRGGFGNPYFTRKIREARGNKCEVCGFLLTTHATHIISPDSGGPRKEWNCLVLCPNCHDTFDNFFKPRIYKAFAYMNELNNAGLRVPDDWRNAEGRGKKDL